MTGADGAHRSMLVWSYIARAVRIWNVFMFIALDVFVPAWRVLGFWLMPPLLATYVYAKVCWINDLTNTDMSMTF
jgi:hypothetical protein